MPFSYDVSEIIPQQYSGDGKVFSIGVPFSWKGDPVDFEIAASRYTQIRNPFLFGVRLGIRLDDDKYWLVAEGGEEVVKRVVADFLAYSTLFGSFEGVLH